MLMNAINEKRRTTRLVIETDVTLSDQKENTYKGVIKNLSTIGALIETDDTLLMDGYYTISITLRGDNSDLCIRNLSAKVIRTESGSFAVEFTDTMEWLTLFYVYRQKLHVS